MIHVLIYLFKCSILTLIILVLGNMLSFRGQTLSDQVKIHLAHNQDHLDSAIDELARVSRSLAEETRKGFHKKHFPE